MWGAPPKKYRETGIVGVGRTPVLWTDRFHEQVNARSFTIGGRQQEPKAMSKKKAKVPARPDGQKGKRTARAKAADGTRKHDRKEDSGKDDGEDGGEDGEDLMRRLTWFREFHGTGVDDPGRARLQAIRHTEAMTEFHPEEHLPKGGAPKEAFAAERDGKKIPMALRKAKNPRPASSFGFAAEPVEVGMREGAGTTLKIRLNSATTKRLDKGTIRMFRFEASIRKWVLVPRSGVSPGGEYAWVTLHRPGLYVPIGLPADPWLLYSVLQMRSAQTMLLRDDAIGKGSSWLRMLADQVFNEGLFRGLKDDPAAIEGLGMPPFQKGMGPVELRDLILGLDLPMPGGLAEWDILDDICPPWRGPIFPGHWFLPPFYHLPILWFLGWRSRGPWNINGRIKCVVRHPSDSNILYAGAADGGVWKSVDGGVRWQPKMLKQLSMAIGGLAISASDPNILYAATGEDTPGWGPSFGGAGVYKTMNGGATWTLCGPIGSDRCTRVQIHPTNADIVYVSGNGGLHKSIDGGVGWTNLRTDHCSDVLLDTWNADVIYAAVWNDGIYKSTNGGGVWGTRLSVPLPAGSSAEWIKLAASHYYVPERTIRIPWLRRVTYLVAKMGTDSGLLFFSVDGGATWGQFAGSHGAVSYNEWTNLLALKEFDPDMIFAGGVGLERSTDRGVSFSGTAGTHSDHHMIAFDPNDDARCDAATDGGVYRSVNDGANWALNSDRLVATQLYSIGVSQTAPFLLGGATQDQGIIKTTGPTVWSDTGAGNEGGFFIVDPNNENNIYVTPWNGNLRRSTNGGSAWTTILNGLPMPGTPPATIGVAHLAVQPGNSNVLLCSGADQVCRSIDQGTTWGAVFTTDGNANRVAFAPTDANRCYAASNSGRIYRNDNAGTAGNWAEACTVANRPPAGNVTCIAVGWNDPDLVVITYSNFGSPHVAISRDGGAHWMAANGTVAGMTLPDIPANAVVIDQNNPDRLYVATDIGVFTTSDAGASWAEFNFNLPRIVISELVLRKPNNTLYASTMGRGAYSYWL